MKKVIVVVGVSLVATFTTLQAHQFTDNAKKFFRQC